MNERQEIVSTTESTTAGSGSAAPVAETVQSTIADPFARRRENAYKMRQGIYILFGFIEGLLAIRFVLRLFGANSEAGFAQLIYGITAPLVAPFYGLFGNPTAQGSVLEVHSIVALIVYALLAWLVVRLTWILVGESRSAVKTHSTAVDTRL